MISVVILTLNEAANLPRCMASVAWSDDVVMLDSGSTDGTTEVAQAHGARVMTRQFDSFAGQRNHAMEHAGFRHPWVLQLDADVATFAYSHLRPPFTNAEAAARGWLPLPCPTACPPVQLPQDALFTVLLSWLSPATPGAKTVVCIPAMNTGAWQAAAKLPAGHPLLVDLECSADIEAQMQHLPLTLKVDKKKRESRLNAAAAVTQRWAAVTAICSRAHAFDQAIRTAFP